MKKYITFFGILTMFFAGMHLSTAQEQTQEQLKAQRADAAKKREMGMAKSQTLSPEEIAKQQTSNLTKLVGLDEKQSVRVHDIFLSVEKKMSRLATVSDEAKKSEEIQNVENEKNQKLKDVLTPEQFKRYLDSVQNEKR